MRFDIWSREREAAEQIEHGIRVSRGDNPVSIRLWNPKAVKPTVSYSFRTVEARDDYVRRYVAAFTAQREGHEQVKQQRKGTPEQLATIQPGSIFVYSWGWEQTNVQFYEVTERHGRTLTLRELAQTSTGLTGNGMADHRMPRPGVFLDELPTAIQGSGGSNPRTNGGKPFTKVVRFLSDGRAYLSFEFGWCQLWDGKPEYHSWYA